jgi:hypothetical protein
MHDEAIHCPAALAIGAFATLVPASASAQATDDRQFRALIYGWLPRIDGKTAFPPASGGSNINIVDQVSAAVQDRIHVEQSPDLRPPAEGEGGDREGANAGREASAAAMNK